MIESQYTSNVGKRLPTALFRSWKINDNFAGGVPDAFYRSKSGVKPLWAEYKFIKQLPKRGTTKIKPNLSEQQLFWLKEALAANELAVVIVGCESIKYKRQVCGVVLTDPTEWEEGITADDFALRAETMNYDAMAEYISKVTTQGVITNPE
ncbi:hypothetical protein J8Z28_20300 [Pseudoalteromonas sp. SCSIO 43088]|uniref:hypothetical protein n=1 Tax=Pseudoalteromonas sp. SCSIO 43088 TaxID=2822846 RepID=UPI00202B5813|nr:hypothetical protein [Pseudoalteromonas sp. SCSIO 43088]URQ88229.1 hypothetical protein J8Z28_20300 [Pseudoalteromonas sp. SCSIO 43088]